MALRPGLAASAALADPMTNVNAAIKTIIKVFLMTTTSPFLTFGTFAISQALRTWPILRLTHFNWAHNHPRVSIELDNSNRKKVSIGK